MTKIENFTRIKELIANAEGAEEQIEFCDAQIELLTNQAAKAAERREAKAKELDEVRKLVLSKVTSDPQTAQEIFEQIDDGEITKNKVVARLTQLVKANEVVKNKAKIEGIKGKSSVYTLA